MLRKIYYALSPSMRLLARKIVYWPIDLFGVKNDLIPPQGLIYTGRGDFIKVGKFWAAKFIEEGKLDLNDNLLDIGSGIGRMAVGLVDYLKEGQYEGFDAVSQGVDWCKDNIQSKYPNFNFTYADLSNDLYKSNGIDASTFVFPYASDTFDFAISISVFTHMLPDEIDNYLSEASRTLKSGGGFLATFFIVDDHYKTSTTGFNFPYDHGHYFLMDESVKSANVALKKEYLYSIVEKNGFQIEKLVHGYWQQSIPQKDNDFQDYLILRKL